MAIMKMIAINVPISACNLRCHYCYISQLDNWEKRNKGDIIDPVKIEKAFSAKRLGGACIINLTGKGETLIPKEMPEVLRRLLLQGHYLEVVTNGTLSQRFDEIAKFPTELLNRLEFKFSFHYLELRNKGWLDLFFKNVLKMRDCGCAFTIELMPNDEILPYIEDIKKICLDKVGALCQLTIGRDDTDNRKILTKLTPEEYLKIWGSFDSDMFKFKYSVFDVKRCEFCYAGMWTLYVDLISGKASQCYGFKPDQNVYDNLDKPLYFRPVGRKCKQPFCFNGHAFLTLGVVPELETPTYADIRDRVDQEGNHWLTKEIADAFSSKLIDTNKKVEGLERFLYYLKTPWHVIKVLRTNKDSLLRRLKLRK